MNTREHDEMIARRDALKDVMEHHFTSVAPIKRIPIPEKIASSDWFVDNGLAEIVIPYGLMCFLLAGFSGKVVAAFKILLELFEEGILYPELTIVAATSGNFGYAMGILLLSRSRVFNVKEFIAVIDRSTPLGKVAHLRRSGARVVFAPDGVSAIAYADKLGKLPDYYTVNQYTHPGNLHGQQWIANAIYGALGDKLSVFVAAVGSTATVVGAHCYLRPLLDFGFESFNESNLKVIGVASMSDAEKVPGSRTEKGLEVTGFDYQSALDYPLVTDVSLYEALETSQGLISSQISAGPTGGLAYAGFYKILERECKAGRLESMKNREGNIVPIMVEIDTFLPYSTLYDEVLGFN